MRADFSMLPEEQELADFNEDEVDVRILVVGDRGCGKTSIIFCLLEDQFVQKVPANIETVLIPADVTGVVTAIVDYSVPRVHDEAALQQMIQTATVIVVVFSIEKEDNLERVRTHWMPLIHESLGEEQRPVLIVANKSDDSKSDHIGKMCSALAKKNVSEVFYYAQRAVIYPMAPLYDVNKRELTTRFKKALLSDVDGDGLLSDQELKLFQQRAFQVPLTDQALAEVKDVILSYETHGVIDSGISLRGFFYLHEAFMQRGRQETAWMCLQRFGYNRSLPAIFRLLVPDRQHPDGLVDRTLFDEDRDGKLLPLELKNLLSVCPAHSWPPDFLHSSMLDENGWLSEKSFICLWQLRVTLDLALAFEQLAYLGFNVEHTNQLEAIVITRDRRIDIAERSTERNVFQCKLIGPKGAGKTVFMRSFLGESLNATIQLRPHETPSYVINQVDVKGLTKYLIMHEVDVYSADDQLTNFETNADVICLLYDGTDPNSFAYCAKLYLRYFYRTKVPLLFVSSKSAYEYEQGFEFQPSDFCLTHQLPKPFRFVEVGNAQAPVFSQLCTMAAFPHLKRVFFLHDSSLLSKLTFGAAVAALGAFLIDNSIVNQRPRLECLADSIVVHVQTAGPFFGRVFVKNHAHEPECTIRGDGQTTLASLHLPFEHCFLRRQRVLAPKAGVIVTTTIVVSFHPFVLTAADGAFRVQCVYLSDRQHLGASLAIASLSTPLFSSPLPRCKYEAGAVPGHVVCRFWKAARTVT
ncbi:Mitochondrial Rho GTPase [Aphelenchoides fujianensis]|nr:Mitochondrial Rho GTPase [Aphelenchoides fujianensis]